MTKTDRMCGIDRYESSPLYGELAVEVILLYKTPGKHVRSPSAISAALKHGDPVDVLDSKVVKDMLYYKVRCHEYPTPQEGWCSAVFLEKAGADRPGIAGLLLDPPA